MIFGRIIFIVSVGIVWFVFAYMLINGDILELMDWNMMTRNSREKNMVLWLFCIVCRLKHVFARFFSLLWHNILRTVARDALVMLF